MKFESKKQKVRLEIFLKTQKKFHDLKIYKNKFINKFVI